MLNAVDLYCFSPTGGTRQVGELLTRSLGNQVRVQELGDRGPLTQPEGELAVVAMPVFGGRIPAFAAEKLKTLRGEGKAAVALAVYGNRAYEDALAEMQDLLEEAGFRLAAAGAFVARHSVVPAVAAGRPDDRDAAELADFGAKILARLAQGEWASVTVPGDRPYKDVFSLPVTPVSTDACTRCGACAAACPTEAIALAEGIPVTDAPRCFLCLACKSACPAGARLLPPPVLAQMEQKLLPLKELRREKEVFL